MFEIITVLTVQGPVSESSFIKLKSKPELKVGLFLGVKECLRSFWFQNKGPLLHGQQKQL